LNPSARPALPQTLDQWLEHIERVHPRTIEMGLARVSAVRDALRLDHSCPVITVGGTNGKGSACAMLEAILDHAGYRTGCYVSPHLLRYNERVRLARSDASDGDLVRAFAAVEAARGDVALTYFEFGTLAAMWLFAEKRVEVSVLEVGLGGRLDAVNAFEPDCALVMSIALDHMDYLGETRETIGAEKAGIFRPGRPAICADYDPPRALVERALEIGAQLLLIGRDFGCEAGPRQWRYWGPRGERHALPHPALRGDYQVPNAAACLAALDALRALLPVSANDIRTGLLTAVNPGRFQVLPGRPAVILDVAHNPAAAAALARNLARLPREGPTLAVFAMLKDKDVDGVIAAVKGEVDEWFVSGIAAERGGDSGFIRNALARAGVIETVSSYDSVAAAYAAACDKAGQNARIVVFGSFHTVAAVVAAR
jgi:dihydrofolate synthase/folylpolyglutamate synthase